ncbi:MAG: type II toxin-antitoxin system VapC family toxin [Gallionellaceae bacterium]
MSALVHSEAKLGDIEAAKRRIALLEGILPLELTSEVYELANRLVVGSALPAKAKEDSFHIAIATVHGMDFLLTWNCKHIANATMRSKILSICEKAGYQPSVICTPEELLGDHNVERPNY